MKFSYSQKLDKYVVTELGKLIDSDEDGMALAIRHGLVEGDADDDDQEQFVIDAPEFDDFTAEVPEIIEFLREAPSFEIWLPDNDDDLQLINDFFFEADT